MSITFLNSLEERFLACYSIKRWATKSIFVKEYANESILQTKIGDGSNSM